MTLQKESIGVAHIVPRSEKRWFRYRSNSLDTFLFEDPANKLVLHSGIQKLLDEPALTIVPKELEHGPGQNEQEVGLFLHLVRARGSQQELVTLYSDVQLQNLCGVSVRLLFCRFALSIFGYMSEFLSANVPRWVALSTEGGWPDVEHLSADKCRLWGLRSRFRIPSPRKTHENEDSYIMTLSDEDPPQLIGDEEVHRGRKRRRSD